MMTNKRTISVIIPVYNVEKYLDQCLLSVVSQKYKNLEILLIDDGSTDLSSSICESWEKKDGRIKVYHKTNGGLASARNFGLDKATGDYIAFVDSDDFINLDMYSDMMLMFSTDDEIDIVCAAGQRFFENTFYEEYFVYYETGTVLESSIVVERILKDEIASHVVKGLYKKNCWDDIRFPLNRLYEDIPVTFLAYYKARKIGFIKKPFYFYRENPESISNTPKAIKPFHLFLGFEQHYLFSKDHFPDIERFCLEKTAHFAISTVFHFYSEKNPELKEPAKQTELFLKKHKKELKGKMHAIPKSRRSAIKLFYFSKTVFKVFCRMMNVFGIQKKMGFEEK